MPKINLESTEDLTRAIMHILHNRRQGNRLIADVLTEKLPTSAFGLLSIYKKEGIKGKRDFIREFEKIKN